MKEKKVRELAVSNGEHPNNSLHANYMLMNYLLSMRLLKSESDVLVWEDADDSAPRTGARVSVCFQLHSVGPVPRGSAASSWRRFGSLQKL